MATKHSYLGGFCVGDKLFDHVICTKTDATFIKGLNETGKAELIYSVNSNAITYELVKGGYVHIGKFNLDYKNNIWYFAPNDKNEVDAFKDLRHSDLLRTERLVFERMLTRKLSKTTEGAKEL